MTSQVMILTKRFGILATDRQQTMADGKTYGGINKIFELYKLHSAGVMLNGNPDLQEVPMETLITEFKSKTNFNEIKTIKEIKDRFIKFFCENTDYSSVDEYITSKLLSFKYNMISEINHFGFSNVVKERSKKDICPFIYQYSNFNHEFDDIIPDNLDRKDYVEILWQIFSFDIQNEVTGVVLSGFDLESYYPSFFEIEIYFNNQGKILYDIVDFAISSKKPIVKVFAIKREACTFIIGVNDEFIDYILKYVYDVNEAIVENLKWDLEEYDIENSDKILEFLKNKQNKEYSNFNNDIKDFRLDALIDTTYSIENLPEWLLCLFSDLLIRLTAIKQKTTSEIESVSIDSDILIISKAYPFKWIKSQNRIL